MNKTALSSHVTRQILVEIILEKGYQPDDLCHLTGASIDQLLDPNEYIPYSSFFPFTPALKNNVGGQTYPVRVIIYVSPLMRVYDGGQFGGGLGLVKFPLFVSPQAEPHIANIRINPL